MDELFIGSTLEIKPLSRFGHAHVVYVMGIDEDGPVKIGISSDIARRVLSLQTGNPMPIRVFGLRLAMPMVIPAGRMVNIPLHLKHGASALENHIHLELTKMGLRMMGEWFDISSVEAIHVIEKCASQVRLRAISANWLACGDAKMDPEFGWIADKLSSIALTAQAQAARVNRVALTFLEKTGNL